MLDVDQALAKVKATKTDEQRKKDMTEVVHALFYLGEDAAQEVARRQVERDVASGRLTDKDDQAF